MNVRIYLETLRLFAENCFSCLRTTWYRAEKKAKKLRSKTVTGNILKVMVSKLLLNEIRYIKVSGSLSLFISLRWLLSHLSDGNPITPLMYFFPLFSYIFIYIYIYLRVIAGNWIICAHTDHYFWKLFLGFSRWQGMVTTTMVRGKRVANPVL
jgi:hypothetical protein